jgi:hypothetical protein
VSLDGVPVHPVALEPSPEIFSRAAAPSVRLAATPPRPPPHLASRAHAPRIDATRASNRAPEPWIGVAGESRHHSLPAAAVGLRSPPPRRLHVSLAAGSRSDAPDSIPLPHLTRGRYSR